jgi:YD repeat-containing protein
MIPWTSQLLDFVVVAIRLVVAGFLTVASGDELDDENPLIGQGGNLACGNSAVYSSVPQFGNGWAYWSACFSTPNYSEESESSPQGLAGYGVKGTTSPIYPNEDTCPECGSPPVQPIIDLTGGELITSSGGSCCTTCGSSGWYMPTAMSPAIVARSVKRFWSPNNRASNASFSPGIYSQYDSQLNLYSEATGSTIAFFDANAQAIYLLVDGRDGDTLDGVFHDLTNNHVRQLVLETSTGATTSRFSNAAKAVVTHYNGFKEEFQIFDLDPGIQDQLAGRLTKRIDRDNRELVVTYKSWAGPQVQESPNRQWQIQQISDSLANTLTFTYAISQVGGMWPVTHIARNDGAILTYSYSGNALETVSNSGGEIASYSYGQDPVAQTATVTIKDQGFKNGQQVTFYLTNDFITLFRANQSSLVNQPVGVCRMQKNAANQTEWLLIPASNPSDPSRFIFKGGNRAVVDYTAMRWQAFESWRYDPDAPNVRYYGITGSLSPQLIGVPTKTTLSQLRSSQIPSLTNHIASQKIFQYDSSGRVVQVTYPQDGTYSTKTYNSLSQVLRERGRDGKVVHFEYDSQGHLLTKKVGLVEQNNADVPTIDFGEYSYEYFPAAHVNKGLVKTEKTTSPNKGSGLDHHVKEYEYDDQGRITVVSGSPNTERGPASTVRYSYDATGNLESETDSSGNIIRHQYDSSGRRTKTIYRGNASENVL